MSRTVVTLLGLLVCSAATAAIDKDAARRAFAAFDTNCSRDDGKLLGVSLCGTVVIVDKPVRDAIASDGWSGRLPDSIGIANTAFDWKGTRASMVLWPLPGEAAARDRLLLHERFHAIQDGAGLPMSPPSANGHLDTLDGRYLTRLEMRALRTALLAKSAGPALAFRRARLEKFPAAAAQEAALDRNEGMAEYTAVRLFTADRSRMIARAAAGLEEGEQSSAFARSYAYATWEGHGTVYEHLTVSDDWGKIVLDHGALISDDFKTLTAPATSPNITLAPGWRIASGQRSGDLIVLRDVQ